MGTDLKILSYSVRYSKVSGLHDFDYLRGSIILAENVKQKKKGKLTKSFPLSAASFGSAYLQSTRTPTWIIRGSPAFNGFPKSSRP